MYNISIAKGSKPKLISGPMQGHTTATETKLWLLVRDAPNVKVTLTSATTHKTYTLETSSAGIKDYKRMVPVTLDFKGLEPATEYQVEIVLAGQTVSNNRHIKTLSANPREYSFLVASCAFLPPHGFRWIQSGISARTYPYVMKTPSDFMMWTGDYLYLMPWHYKSYNGMMRKYIKTRRQAKMEDLVESRPQYAVWDDHEYGPNDSEKDWKFKEFNYDLFKRFWPNPAYGTDSVKGIFFTYKYGDAQFFMTDDRWYRDERNIPHGEMLGKGQLNWLEQELLKSNSTFKFITVGSQVLSKYNMHESYQRYPEELNCLLKFIADNRITGVVFLTGDVHFTELIKLDRPGAYPLYDFTSSAITSFRNPITKSNSLQNHNPDRVPGTLYDKQNYGRVAVNGPVGNRQCTLETYDNHGKLVWKFVINEKDLQYK